MSKVTELLRLQGARALFAHPAWGRQIMTILFTRGENLWKSGKQTDV
ncbi:hypothetical protein [Anaerobium acetethylicum]|nr:hypothetical protein [Anaerobium acetethylicum]